MVTLFVCKSSKQMVFREKSDLRCLWREDLNGDFYVKQFCTLFALLFETCLDMTCRNIARGFYRDWKPPKKPRPLPGNNFDIDIKYVDFGQENFDLDLYFDIFLRRFNFNLVCDLDFAHFWKKVNVAKTEKVRALTSTSTQLQLRPLSMNNLNFRRRRP